MVQVQFSVHVFSFVALPFPHGGRKEHQLSLRPREHFGGCGVPKIARQLVQWVVLHLHM